MSTSNTFALRMHSVGFTSKLLTKQIQFLLDCFVLATSFLLAYAIRFDFPIPDDLFELALVQLPFVVTIQVAVLLATGIYRFMWRYVGLSEAKRFVEAAVWATVPILAARALLPDALQVGRVPVSIILVDACLAFGGVLALRLARRDIYERRRRNVGRTGAVKRTPILLIGAGRAGVLAASEIQGRGDTDLDVKGFVDDDPAKQGLVIGGARVLGTTRDLPRLAREYSIDHVVISIAKASRREFKNILEICEQVPVKVRVIPGLYEILEGRVKISRIRDLQIEDLLGRDPVQLDGTNVGALIPGKTVMVTGAGGSIGSELARQVARLGPAQLLLVERAEFALFNIVQDLEGAVVKSPFVPLIADVGDLPRMRRIMDTYRPQVVLHAAAHKHVPMMETNSVEAVKNNVLATMLLGELAGEFGVETLVLVSTDKAVRPSSVMGATKRVAELVIQDLNRRFATRFVAVRFGNVIGSAGSVIPIFREQILKGGPVTVTHPDMVRYFMTIPEAAQLVLEAGSMGKGGEIFILDMGEPVRILDLAKETIRLSGFKPEDEIEIVFTGIRPGEKLYEELESSGEELTRTRHPKIFIGEIAPLPPHQLQAAVTRLVALVGNGEEHEIRDALEGLVPECQLRAGAPALERAESAMAMSATGD
jgi:FlaA1/EpsC-like NDP-sugar epimerase